jgi:hypothetical protein
MSYYLTTENEWGHRFLFRCYSTSCGFVSVFVRTLSNREHDDD